jgi:membrane protein required for colicin V production
MTWFPLVALGLLIVMVYVGTKRGFILELFDLLWMFGAFAAASYAKGPLSKFCMKQFHWDVSYAHNFNFLIVFIVVTVIIFFIGVLLNDTLKIFLPDALHTLFGGIFGVLKALLMLYVLVVFVSLFPLKDDARAALHKDFLLQKVQGFTPTMTSLISVLTPPNVGKYYIKQIDEHKL